MATSAFKENSHFEAVSPPASIHGARGDTGEATSNAADAQSDNASSVDHVGEKAPPPVVLTKRQKVKRHCGRFWLWYLIAGIILLAILLPILFKVIIPAIVQDIVNKQQMPVRGGSFVALSPTQLNVSLQTMLNTPLPATIDPLTLFLYNENTTDFSPFINLTLPEQHVNGDTDVVIVNQTVTVTNETELITWFNEVFDQATVKLSTRGDPSVHLGALHTDTHLDHTVEVSALNKLEGFGIQELQLILPPEANGNNLKGTLNLPNWGTLTLGLGNLTLNLLSGDIKIGLITIYDVVLPPGNNTRNFDGQLYLNAIVDNFAAVLASQADALNNGVIQLNSTGNATIVDGQHIAFIEGVLNRKRLTSSISVITLLSDLVNGVMGGGKASLTDVLQDIFGNTTLIDQVMSHWNTTTIGKNGTGSAATTMKRAAPRGMMAWNLLKLGMKMGKR